MNAGWSSPVARQAHNLKVVGSNPTPATKKNNRFLLFKFISNILHQISPENMAFFLFFMI